MTSCKCSIAGDPRFCGRHGIVKPEAWRRLCQTKAAYFDLWEKGKGPGQLPGTIIDANWQPPDDWNVSMSSRGLGDVIAKVTHKLGIKQCGGCKKRQKTLNKWMPFQRRTTKANVRSSNQSRGPFGWRQGQTLEYFTLANLTEDVKRLASQLPVDTSLIVGVARSGLSAASLVAMMLHRPLAIVRQSSNDLIDGGNGWRLTGNTTAAGPVVVIDDTVLTGNSFKHVMPIVRQRYPNAIAAAVYVNPTARLKPDVWVRDLPWPHLLEWNLWNSIISPHCAMDFDGILCHECPPGDDDDGPRYMSFLEHVQPLYLTRRVAIPMVVTARIERYRPLTQAWLARHGVSVAELVMAPWDSKAERNRHDVAAWKAEHYRRFLARRHALRPPLFIESCPHQAVRIAQLAGGFVLCPTAGRVLSPGDPSNEHTFLPAGTTYPAVEVRNLIYHVYPSRANDDWKANLDKLKPHDALFNGKRVIAVAVDSRTATIDEVRDYLAWQRVEYLPCTNDPVLRESATFSALLAAVMSTAWNEATFYAHSKGNTTSENPVGTRRWRNAMYHHLLTRAEECIEHLRLHAAVGTTRISWPAGRHFAWPSRMKQDGNWMFSGTFFWFRNEPVFSRPNCLDVPRDRYGAEAWIGRVLPWEDGCTVLQPFPERFPEHRVSPYDPALYSPEFDQ